MAEAVAAAVAGWGILPSWDQARKPGSSIGLGHNSSKVSETLVEAESSHTNFSRPREQFLSKKNHESGWLGYLKCLSFSGPENDMEFKNSCLLVLEKWKFLDYGLGKFAKTIPPIQNGLRS